MQKNGKEVFVRAFEGDWPIIKQLLAMKLHGVPCWLRENVDIPEIDRSRVLLMDQARKTKTQMFPYWND